MLMTSVLLLIAMQEVWDWSVAAAGAVAALFVVVDASFFSANMAKVVDGGYVPLLLAAAIYGVMWIWHHGAEAVRVRLAEDPVPIKGFTTRMVAQQTPRVPGTAMFLTRQDFDVPPVLLRHLVHNRALHADLIVLTVTTAATPWIEADERLTVKELAPRFWRAHATFGFMERPDIPAVVEGMKRHGCGADMDDITYYVGHSTIIPRNDGQGLPRWQEAIYAALERNATHVGDSLRLPQDKTLELGRQVAI